MKKLLYLLFLFMLVGCVQVPIKDTFTLTFSTTGGETIAAIEGDYQETIMLPTPMRTGYTFSYWYDAQNNNYTNSLVLVDDLHLFAKWEIIQLNVSFWDDETLIAHFLVDYASSQTPPIPPIKSGYVFVGWEGNFNTIYADSDIFAQYEASTDGLVFTLNDEETAYSITHYQGTNQTVIIPSTYFMLPVTAIAEEAFKSNTTIKHILLPETITTIESQAFYECTFLETILLPDSLISIGTESFYSCISLGSVRIAASTIGTAAFYGCTALQEIILLDSVTTIKALAFYGCNGLKSLFIPESVSTIENGIINWCRKLEYIYTPMNNLSRLLTLFDEAGNYIYANPQIVGVE